MYTKFNKHDILIAEWFNNVLNGKQNDEILFLEDIFENTVSTINNLLKNSTDSQQKNYIITDATTYFNGTDKKKNIILYPSVKKDGLSPMGLKKFAKYKFLFVHREYDFYSNIKKYIDLKSIKNYPKADILERERYLYYIEKIDPLDLIMDRNESELKSFLEDSIDRNFIFFGSKDRYNLLIDKTSFKRETLYNSVDVDISYLKECQILTSRLAVVIYRVANLNLYATATEAGRYFHKKLGNKSKTYNYDLIQKYKRPSRIFVDYDLHNKNFKAYDLTINESEMSIRKEIAEKLLTFKKYKFDVDTIAKITSLPIDEVEKMTKKF